MLFVFFFTFLSMSCKKDSNEDQLVDSSVTVDMVNTNTTDNQNLSIIRQSGFQPLRIVKYWKRKEDLLYKRNETKDNFIWEKTKYTNIFITN